jgi:hypothetical protein
MFLLRIRDESSVTSQPTRHPHASAVSGSSSAAAKKNTMPSTGTADI